MDFFAKREAALNGKTQGPQIPPKIEAAHPVLACALRGREETPGKPAMAPLSLSIWADESGLRCCLSARGTEEAWFGGLGDGKSLGELVEHLLVSGGLELRRKKGEKLPF